MVEDNRIKQVIEHLPAWGGTSGTDFIYEVLLPAGTDFNREQFNRTTRSENAIQRLENEYHAELKFRGTQSQTLQQNLRMIDGDLPEIMAELLLARYRSGEASLSKNLERVTKRNPLGFNLESGHPFYVYKVKMFLQDVAMGMTPEKVWNGIYDATGGQIIVKESGDVVCYHIYEQNRFLEFLLRATYFEQPATGEDHDRPGHAEAGAKKNYFFGRVYEEEGRHYVKLSLQVRYK